MNILKEIQTQLVDIRNPEGSLNSEELASSIRCIPALEYYCWIPNNSGLLRWERIALHAENERISFKKSEFSSNDNNITPIWSFDTKVEIEDDSPTLYNTIKKILKKYIFNKKSIAHRKQLFRDNGFSLKSKALFFTEIEFMQMIDGKPEHVVSGKGHYVSDGVYIGKASLVFVTNKIYKEIMNLNALSRMNDINSTVKNDPEIVSALYHEYKELEKEIKNVLNDNGVIKTISLSFTVEGKGKITLNPLELKVSSRFPENGFESIASPEGYKNYVQLLYGLIKKTFHGDNHHHHKDDVILRVYSEHCQPTIILDQMASHLKGLEKIEQSRQNMKCREFVPLYSHEAKGVVAYSKMYYQNYLKASFEDEGTRLLTAIEAVESSIVSTIERFKDQESRSKKSSKTFAEEFPFWIMTISLFTAYFSIDGNRALDIPLIIFGELLISFLFVNDIVSSIVIVGFFFWIYLVISKHKRDQKECIGKHLHTDNRPKDTFHTRLFDKKGKTRWLLLVPSVIKLAVITTLFVVLLNFS